MIRAAPTWVQERLRKPDGDPMNTDERLKKLLDASRDQLEAIDGILERRITETFSPTQGPLLLGMSASAKFLGVSRATLWRMIKAGLLQKVEVLPGSFRLRRADLEAIAAGRRMCRSEVAPDSCDAPQHLDTPTHRDSSLVAA
jgi:predicted DNA-binding transcriptional regulator AlpA